MLLLGEGARVQGKGPEPSWDLGEHLRCSWGHVGPAGAVKTSVSSPLRRGQPSEPRLRSQPGGSLTFVSPSLVSHLFKVKK